jgi:hypothetical protein
MTRFIETEDCGLVNTNDIRRIIRGGDDAVALLRDGEKAKLPLGDGAIQLSGLGVIAAAPGWYALTLCDGCGDLVEKLPVVAWGVSSTGQATPISSQDGLTLYRHGVLAPDGSVSVVFDRTFASVDEWIEAEKARPPDDDPEGARKPDMIDAEAQSRATMKALRDMKPAQPSTNRRH